MSLVGESPEVRQSVESSAAGLDRENVFWSAACATATRPLT